MPDRRAEVIAAWDEGPLMRAVRLTPVPEYRPGQALRVYHEGSSAFFALATAFGNGRSPELLLRRGGGVADGLIGRMQPGAVVELDGPLGPGFPVERGRGRDVLCAAAGSAISPIRALLEAITDERDAYGRVVLFYGQERADEFAYPKVRATLAERGVEIVLCAHTPDDGWRGERGFVQDVLVAGGARVDTAGAVAYLCGMPGMVSGVREALAGLGLSADRTFLNY